MPLSSFGGDDVIVAVFLTAVLVRPFGDDLRMSVSVELLTFPAISFFLLLLLLLFSSSFFLLSL